MINLPFNLIFLISVLVPFLLHSILFNYYSVDFETSNNALKTSLLQNLSMQFLESEKKCVVVYGTRPELIKLMPVIRELKMNPNVCDLAVVSTGQHQELIKPLEEYFGLDPNITLKLMVAGQPIGTLYAKAVTAMTDLFHAIHPLMIIIQGDTTTAVAASAAAFHNDIHVVHVEAGLRTGDLSAPFPEEYNRKVIGLTCSLCFAPTETAKQALINEGINSDRIYQVGNTVIDQLQHSTQNPPAKVVINGILLDSITKRMDGRTRLHLKELTSQLLDKKKHMVLVTAHRRENAASGAFIRIGEALKELAKKHSDTLFIVPLHYNPAVRSTLIPMLESVTNIWVVEPAPYPIFIQVLLRVTIILTDSGGLQEEGISLNIPVLVMRRKTERMEGVRSGGALLVGDSKEEIFKACSALISNADQYSKMANAINPFGDGTSSKKIIDLILKNRDYLKQNLPRFILQFNTFIPMLA